VQQNELSLEFASPELITDNWQDLAAAKRNGLTLQDASQALNEKTEETKSGVLSALTKPMKDMIRIIGNKAKKAKTSLGSSSSSSSNNNNNNRFTMRP